MKIWCCLLFSDDDSAEEGDQLLLPTAAMENKDDGRFSNEGDNEGENDYPREAAPGDGEHNHPSHDLSPGLYDDMIIAMEDETKRFEMLPWSSGVRFFPFNEGESSSSATAAGVDCAIEDPDHDSHHKRAKVHSGLQTHSDASEANLFVEGNFSYCPGASGPSDMRMQRQNLFLHNHTDECTKSDRDENVSMEIEDFDVRMDLTDDLLHMVFSFLDHIDLCRAAKVCRQWRASSAHEDFWRCLNFENSTISLEQFDDMCQRYRNATEVNVYGAPRIHSLAMNAVSSLRNLEVLTVGRGHLGDDFFHALAECNLLRSLNVSEAILGNGGQEVPLNHDRLRDLKITKCRVMRLSIRCPQLMTLSLKRSNMAQAILNCPLLRLLDIGSCHKLSDAAIRSAATSCPQLESLDMSNCSCVSDETLREVAGACSNLHVLNASYCPNISLETVTLGMLTVLKLHSCEGITSASMAAIARSPMLEVLELDNCNLLASVSLDLSRLQSIRLVHCRKFADLNLRSTMLSSIMVSNCPALRRITITSNSLQRLALQKQENLTTLALQCQSLQEVDLSDCESLSNAVCDIFSGDGGCPMLKSLVLDNCESLTAVRFCNSSLDSLSLVGCRAMTSLELNCPRLKRLSLDGCDHLERAFLQPVALHSLNLGICPKLSALSIGAPYMVSLELKGCGVLSEASIICPLLTSLDASFCSQLKDDCLSATTISCPLIESLVLMSCPSIGSEGLYALRSLPNLTMLDLSYTFLTNLRPVFESCLRLKVLKLQACKYLTDSSLEPLYKEDALPSLQELDLSYGTLCQTAIEELLACCTHLTHLSLNGCINMHDLNWGSNNAQLFEPRVSYLAPGMFTGEKDTQLPIEPTNRLLQTLNCVGCPNIRKVFIPPTARCYHLLSLNLSLSANLKEVDLACFNLVVLNLSNCCSLERLKLGCPKLTSLFLQSCNIDESEVEAAISHCSMLETLDVRFCPKISLMSMGKFRAASPSLKRIFSGPTASHD